MAILFYVFSSIKSSAHFPWSLLSMMSMLPFAEKLDTMEESFQHFPSPHQLAREAPLHIVFLT